LNVVQLQPPKRSTAPQLPRSVQHAAGAGTNGMTDIGIGHVLTSQSETPPSPLGTGPLPPAPPAGLRHIPQLPYEKPVGEVALATQLLVPVAPPAQLQLMLALPLSHGSPPNGGAPALPAAPPPVPLGMVSLPKVGTPSAHANSASAATQIACLPNIPTTSTHI
jgi:hypothetical protein